MKSHGLHALIASREQGQVRHIATAEKAVPYEIGESVELRILPAIAGNPVAALQTRNRLPNVAEDAAHRGKAGRASTGSDPVAYRVDMPEPASIPIDNGRR